MGMSAEENKAETYYIGLSMAGAISAGAYSGGVLDFLVEALEAWEARKKQLRAEKVDPSEWDVPCHNVVIPAISGASAGGITGALGLIAMVDANRAAMGPQAVPGVGTVTPQLQRIYKAWVKHPSFLGAGEIPGLLGTANLTPGGLVSLLDAGALDLIAQQAITGVALAPPKPYLAQTVHLFVTHTNLRGIPCDINFANGIPGQPGYPMTFHGDRVHYAVENAGTATFASQWADPDPSRLLYLAQLPLEDVLTGSWRDFADVVLGTAAFPVGLAAREIKGATVGEYVARQWTFASTMNGQTYFRLPPSEPLVPQGTSGLMQLSTAKARALFPQSVSYVASDGGIIDNEPFQLVRWTLMDKPPERNESDGKKNDRAVILIDPFPEADAYDTGAAADITLMAVIKALFPALKNQARFKPDEMAAAFDETYFSRYLIAPRRWKKDKATARPTLETYGIACGLLGGFGGFLSEAFRAHDYALGRANCYRFLTEHFALPENNWVILSGYNNKPKIGANYHTKPDKNGVRFAQIIPVLVPPPPDQLGWPKVNRSDVEAMVAGVKVRADALVKIALADTKTVRSWWLRNGLRLFWWCKGKRKLERYVRWAVLSDLIRRDQLNWAVAGQSEIERKVFAALADPAYDLRTVEGIVARDRLNRGLAARAKLDDTSVRNALAAYPSLIWMDEKRKAYTLVERKPCLSERYGDLSVD